MRPHNAFTIVLAAAGAGAVLGIAGIVSLPAVLAGIPWGILIIFVSLDIFTKLIVRTGIMELLAARLLRFSRGRRVRVLWTFGLLLFVISSVLNNLTAVIVILPVAFLLLRAMKLDQVYVAGLFALILAASNLGGAATPIGDFPAILIMDSGITTFNSYLISAWPLFAVTMVVLVLFHILSYRVRTKWRRGAGGGVRREAEVIRLMEQYGQQEQDWPLFTCLAVFFALMFAAWMFFPASVMPPSMPAITGLAAGVVVTYYLRGVTPYGAYNLTPVFAIGAFLYVASMAAETGLLEQVALGLQHWAAAPQVLLLALMVLTAVLTGIFSAGPTAAAMLPVVQSLVAPGSTLAGCHDQVAVAFAASICAGSSLFVWSATAGFVLMDKFKSSNLRGRDDVPLHWGVGPYLYYGLAHFTIQLTLGIVWALIFVPFD
jgi:Na+/H+ antiporter NhaD/arsenite permease-like protein